MYIIITKSLDLSSCVKMNEECVFVCGHYTNTAVGQRLVPA